jgi:hypothetical protein
VIVEDPSSLVIDHRPSVPPHLRSQPSSPPNSSTCIAPPPRATRSTRATRRCPFACREQGPRQRQQHGPYFWCRRSGSTFGLEAAGKGTAQEHIAESPEKNRHLQLHRSPPPASTAPTSTSSCSLKPAPSLGSYLHQHVI